MNQKDSILTYSALTGAVIIWGLSFISTKIILSSFTVGTYISIRFFLAAVTFFFICLKKGFPRYSRQTNKKLFLLSLFQPFLYFFFETTGLSRTTASIASLLIAIIPVVVLVIARIFIKEKISRKKIFGIILSFIGILLLVTGGTKITHGESGSIVGNLLILGAVFSAAFYIVLGRNLGEEVSSFHLTASQIFYGALFFFPFFFFDLTSMDWSQVTTVSIGALCFNVFCSTLGAFLLYNYGLTRLTASKTSLFLNAIPLVTALGAWAVLGETLTFFQIGGGALVVLSVVLTSFTRRST